MPLDGSVPAAIVSCAAVWVGSVGAARPITDAAAFSPTVIDSDETVGAMVSTWSPAKLALAPVSTAALPAASIIEAPIERAAPVTASAAVFCPAATVVLNTRLAVPEPDT